MADNKRTSGNHRQVMGPPETPSRVMQASPNLFPSLQFSPDFFSNQMMSPMSGPMYPQQRLFWDVSGPPAPSPTYEQAFNTYPDTWDTSFTSTTTVTPGFVPSMPQEQSYELPLQPQSAGPFFGPAGFPAPFHTSPRMIPPQHENPAEFLSSPARRFGGPDTAGAMQQRRPIREVPAYYHQMQESKREMELERDRRRTKAAKRADDEMLMNSVRRALTPAKGAKPALKRSFTHSGITAQQLHTRQQTRSTFNDSASTSSAASNLSSRNGRSSPLKRTFSAAGLERTGSFQKPRTAVTLAIDENGVAKTVLEDLPESDDDDDNLSASMTSSIDENDMHILHSQTNSFAFGEQDDVLGSLHNPATVRKSSQRSYDQLGSESAKRLNRLSLGSFSTTEPPRKRGFEDTIRPAKKTSIFDVSYEQGDAQKALRAIIQDRSRSNSTLDDYPSSRQSDSSVQFHSSPPIQQGPFGAFNASPTTATDPDLATPSTDQETFAAGAMRCICNSTLPDSSVVQCELCAKWLHTTCLGMDRRQMSGPYICIYCDQTPMRHTSSRGSTRSSVRGGGGHSASPLAHKSSTARPYRGRS